MSFSRYHSKLNDRSPVSKSWEFALSSLSSPIMDDEHPRSLGSHVSLTTQGMGILSQASLFSVANPWTHITLGDGEWQWCWCCSTRAVWCDCDEDEWGWEVSHVTPGSALCHLPFVWRAALICVHNSLLHAGDLLKTKLLFLVIWVYK